MSLNHIIFNRSGDDAIGTYPLRGITKRKRGEPRFFGEPLGKALPIASQEEQLKKNELAAQQEWHAKLLNDIQQHWEKNPSTANRIRTALNLLNNVFTSVSTGLSNLKEKPSDKSPEETIVVSPIGDFLLERPQSFQDAKLVADELTAAKPLTKRLFYSALLSRFTYANMRFNTQIQEEFIQNHAEWLAPLVYIISRVPEEGDGLSRYILNKALDKLAGFNQAVWNALLEKTARELPVEEQVQGALGIIERFNLPSSHIFNFLMSQYEQRIERPAEQRQLLKKLRDIQLHLSSAERQKLVAWLSRQGFDHQGIIKPTQKREGLLPDPAELAVQASQERAQKTPQDTSSFHELLSLVQPKTYRNVRTYLLKSHEHKQTQQVHVLFVPDKKVQAEVEQIIHIYEKTQERPITTWHATAKGEGAYPSLKSLNQLLATQDGKPATLLMIVDAHYPLLNRLMGRLSEIYNHPALTVSNKEISTAAHTYFLVIQGSPEETLAALKQYEEGDIEGYTSLLSRVADGLYLPSGSADVIE